MTPTAWSVLVGVLAIAVTVLLFFAGRLLGKLDAKEVELRTLRDAKDQELATLRDANLTYRLAIIELKGTQSLVGRTLDALPTSVERREGTMP